MNYIFPETKFAKENDIGTQSDHVCEEYHEFLDATIGSDEEKEEAMDLYHSLETLFRIWERQGVDMEAVRQKVFEKNRARGYYTTCEICEGKGWFFGQKCIVCDGIGVLKDGKVEDD